MEASLSHFNFGPSNMNFAGVANEMFFTDKRFTQTSDYELDYLSRENSTTSWMCALKEFSQNLNATSHASSQISTNEIKRSNEIFSSTKLHERKEECSQQNIKSFKEKLENNFTKNATKENLDKSNIQINSGVPQPEIVKEDLSYTGVNNNQSPKLLETENRPRACKRKAPKVIIRDSFKKKKRFTKDLIPSSKKTVCNSNKELLREALLKKYISSDKIGDKSSNCGTYDEIPKMTKKELCNNPQSISLQDLSRYYDFSSGQIDKIDNTSSYFSNQKRKLDEEEKTDAKSHSNKKPKIECVNSSNGSTEQIPSHVNEDTDSTIQSSLYQILLLQQLGQSLKKIDEIDSSESKNEKSAVEVSSKNFTSVGDGNVDRISLLAPKESTNDSQLDLFSKLLLAKYLSSCCVLTHENASNGVSPLDDAVRHRSPISLDFDDDLKGSASDLEKEIEDDVFEKRFEEISRDEEDQVESVEWNMWMEKLKGTGVEIRPSGGFGPSTESDSDDIDVILLNVRESISSKAETPNWRTLRKAFEKESYAESASSSSGADLLDNLTKKGFHVSAVSDSPPIDILDEEKNEVSITAVGSPLTLFREKKDDMIVSTLGWSETDASQPVSSSHMLHWSYCRMTNHLLDPTRESFKCPMCEYKSPRKGHVERHILIHSGEKPYSCIDCSYKSHTKDAMTLHSRVHSGNKKFECGFCPYATNRKIYLERHLSLHGESSRASCFVCGERSSKRRRSRLRKKAVLLGTKNGLDKHATEQLESLLNEDLRLEACCSCGGKGSSRKGKVYSEDRPYPCPQCSYRATKKSLLDKHIKVHTGERPFPCPLCKYRASRKAHLLRHMRTHQKELE